MPARLYAPLRPTMVIWGMQWRSSTKFGCSETVMVLIAHGSASDWLANAVNMGLRTERAVLLTPLEVAGNG